MNTVLAKHEGTIKPVIPTTNNEEDYPTLPEHVLLAAKHYTDMVQGKPEHWMTADEVRKSLYKEFGW